MIFWLFSNKDLCSRLIISHGIKSFDSSKFECSKVNNEVILIADKALPVKFKNVELRIRNYKTCFSLSSQISIMNRFLPRNLSEVGALSQLEMTNVI